MELQKSDAILKKRKDRKVHVRIELFPPHSYLGGSVDRQRFGVLHFLLQIGDFVLQFHQSLHVAACFLSGGHHAHLGCGRASRSQKKGRESAEKKKEAIKETKDKERRKRSRKEG